MRSPPARAWRLRPFPSSSCRTASPGGSAPAASSPGGQAPVSEFAFRKRKGVTSCYHQEVTKISPTFVVVLFNEKKTLKTKRVSRFQEFTRPTKKKSEFHEHGWMQITITRRHHQALLRLARQPSASGSRKSAKSMPADGRSLTAAAKARSASRTYPKPFPTSVALSRTSLTPSTALSAPSSFEENRARTCVTFAVSRVGVFGVGVRLWLWWSWLLPARLLSVLFLATVQYPNHAAPRHKSRHHKRQREKKKKKKRMHRRPGTRLNHGAVFVRVEWSEAPIPTVTGQGVFFSFFSITAGIIITNLPFALFLFRCIQAMHVKKQNKKHVLNSGS